MEKNFNAEQFINLYSHKNKNQIENILKGLRDPERYKDRDREKEEKLKLLEQNYTEKLKNNDKEKLHRQYVKKKSAIKRRFEKKKHQLFVDECLAPKGYQEDDHEVFALINDPEDYELEDSNYSIFHVSIVTPLMAYTDYMYFVEHNSEKKPWWYEEYRPYYYDLCLCISKNDEEWYQLYETQKESGWFITEIYSDDSIKDDPSYKSGMLRFGGSASFSYDVSIKLKKQKEDDDKKNYDKEEKEKLLKEVKDLYNIELGKKCWAPKDLNEYLNGVMDKKINQYIIDVLNVGEANCIHVRADNSFSFMFDIGVPFTKYKSPYIRKLWLDNKDYKTGSNIYYSIERISKYKPNFIIISHWHSDHVEGVIKMCDEGLKCHWILPAITDDVKNVTCVRLALYALKSGGCSLIRDTGKSIYSSLNKDIELYRGEEISGDLNSSSIILRIRNMVMPGDSLYEHWPLELKDILENVDELVVPHHGAWISKDDSDVIDKFTNKHQNAYISFGHNGCKHPNKRHIDKLREVGFKVQATGGEIHKKYYGANPRMVSIKNDMISIIL